MSVFYTYLQRRDKKMRVSAERASHQRNLRWNLFEYGRRQIYSACARSGFLRGRDGGRAESAGWDGAVGEL